MIIENTLFALYLTIDGNKQTKKGFKHESKMNGGQTKLNEDKVLSSKNSQPVVGGITKKMQVNPVGGKGGKF